VLLGFAGGTGKGGCNSALRIGKTDSSVIDRMERLLILHSQAANRRCIPQFFELAIDSGGRERRRKVVFVGWGVSGVAKAMSVAYRESLLLSDTQTGAALRRMCGVADRPGQKLIARRRYSYYLQFDGVQPRASIRCAGPFEAMREQAIARFSKSSARSRLAMTVTPGKHGSSGKIYGRRVVVWTDEGRVKRGGRVGC